MNENPNIKRSTMNYLRFLSTRHTGRITAISMIFLLRPTLFFVFSSCRRGGDINIYGAAAFPSAFLGIHKMLKEKGEKMSFFPSFFLSTRKLLWWFFWDVERYHSWLHFFMVKCSICTDFVIGKGENCTWKKVSCSLEYKSASTPRIKKFNPFGFIPVG